MRIELGTEVVDRSGDKVGTVDRIIVNPDSRAIDKIVVQQGFLMKRDTLIDIESIARMEEDKLVLDMSSDRFDTLPEFVEEQYTTIRDADRNALPFIVPNAGGAGMYLWGASDVGRGYDERGSMFEAAPAADVVVENRRNIPETDVVISEGTDVVGVDGDKVGTVDEIVFDSDGRITGFIVRAGFIFTRDVRIPMDWVDATGEDRITLKINADSAEARSYDVEDSTL